MGDMNSILIYDSEVDNPLVTIGIPTYKRGDRLLLEAIDSSLNQENFQHKYEILVVDNNPVRGDITESSMERYNNEHRVAYYKNKENIGPIGNWNRLYELAKGKYVVILHDDDMLFPYYLNVMFSLLESTNYRYQLVYPSYHLSKDRIFPEKNLPLELKYRVFKREDYLVTQWGLPSGMMILKEKFSQIGGFTMDLYPINDQEFIYRALGFMKGCVIYFPLVLYYIGLNTSMKPEIIIDGIIKAKVFNSIIRKDGKNSWRILSHLSYRKQIANLVSWDRNFVDENVIEEAKRKIDFHDNYLKDKLSSLFVWFLKKYLNKIRMHKFCIK